MQVRRQLPLRTQSRRWSGRRLQHNATWAKSTRKGKEGREGGRRTEQSGTGRSERYDSPHHEEKVLFKDEFGLLQVELEDEVRPYSNGERPRLVPKPEEWMTAAAARITIDVRDRLRAVRKGKDLAQQLAPKGIPDAGSNTPVVTHAVDSSIGRSSDQGSTMGR